MTILNKFLRMYGFDIGNSEYIHKSVKFDDFERIKIGNGVVISFGVYFLTHDYSRLVAYNYLNAKDLANGGGYDNPLLGSILIGDNTFIGCRTLILPNTTIGKNCIIGAGSVVKGNIPDESVVFGNPARVIGNIRSFGIKWLKQHGVNFEDVTKNSSN